MHWRKPFPPRSLRPSVMAEFKALVEESFRVEAEKLPKAAVAKEERAPALPSELPHT